MQSEGVSSVFSNTTVQKHYSSGHSLPYGPKLTSVHEYWKHHSCDYMDICLKSDIYAFLIYSRSIITFLPGSNCLLISWLQSSSAVNQSDCDIDHMVMSISRVISWVIFAIASVFSWQNSVRWIIRSQIEHEGCVSEELKGPSVYKNMLFVVNASS